MSSQLSTLMTPFLDESELPHRAIHKSQCRIMNDMRQVLQEGLVEERVQYIVEGLFKIQRDGFAKSGHSQVPDGLDLLEDADKMTVEFDIESNTPDIQQGLNIFKVDPEFEEHEKEYEVRLILNCFMKMS